MSAIPPDWAIKKACEASGHGPNHWAGVKADPRQNPTIVAFAHYIAQHEEAPADPLYEAIHAVVELGRYDTREQAALLRGELATRGLQLIDIATGLPA